MKDRPRKLALCADDFGQSKEISSGIFDLIACRRVSATSVLTEGPDWPESSWRLRELQAHADVGIHLNLTHPFENTSGNRPLLYWLLLTQLGMVSRDWVLQRFLKQIDLFVKYFKRLPDYLDGHQHVHAFPVIRDAMMAAIDTHWSPGSRFASRATTRMRRSARRSMPEPSAVARWWRSGAPTRRADARRVRGSSTAARWRSSPSKTWSPLAHT